VEFLFISGKTSINPDISLFFLKIKSLKKLEAFD